MRHSSTVYNYLEFGEEGSRARFVIGRMVVLVVLRMGPGFTFDFCHHFYILSSLSELNSAKNNINLNRTVQLWELIRT